eukprot:Phypoly_transcript_04851.p1 GENE.Phypoly_transcript_04851~~Phypoly_transcript_04851.p1  ORF type:complete len:642 (-),score=188.67 Phypoly_transcript_04851:55-1980(-)
MANKQPLEPLFKELDGFIQEEEYQKVTKMCDKILAIAPNDPDALKCKVVAFIKLGQIPNAMSVIEALASDKKLAQDFLFEKAYCLYRNKKYDEALETIKGIPKPYPVPVLELEAQVRYRMENYKQCISIYEDLLKKVDSAELKTNLCAAYTEAGMFKENAFFVEKNKSALQETFEFAFNAACAFIATGDYVKAESLLQLAKKVCSDSLVEDGYSPAEVQQELAILQVQLAYCQQLAGQLDAASNLYAEVLKTKASDPVALAVAANNSLALKKGQNPFDAMKRLHTAAPEAVEQKMTAAQRRTLAFNRTLLLLHTGKPEQIKAALEQLEKSGSGAEGLVLLKASLLLKEKQAEQAEKLLSDYTKKNPQSLVVALSLAQIHLSKNAYAQTLAVLEGLSEEYRYKPGVVATITALYEKAGDLEGAGRTLDKYAEWAEKQKDKLDAEQMGQILRLNGEFKLQHKKYEQAYEIFEKVVKKNRNDLKAVAQLVLAAAHFNPSLAQKYEERIPTSETPIDASELEKLPAPSLRSKQTAVPASGEEKQLKKKENKKKKRKPRLPKNAQPGIMPDPERWLPKWQRSYYKKRQKKQQLGKGSQGIATTGHQSVPLAPAGKTAPAAAAAKAPAATASPVSKAQAKKAKKGKK